MARPRGIAYPALILGPLILAALAVTRVVRTDPGQAHTYYIAADEVVFWFQGRMEYGPRALGGRSILGRPDSETLRDRLNLKLKRRVWYQPFCPSILDDEADRLTGLLAELKHRSEASVEAGRAP